MTGELSESKKGVKINTPPVLFSETQVLVNKIEKNLGCVFLSYWNTPSGSVSSNVVYGFYDLLQKIGPQEHIALMIKSSGGSGTASLRIINLLRQYAKKITVYLPLECASAATMMALGADEIVMGPLSYLTPVDTSITHDLSPVDVDNDLVSVSQDELNRILKMLQDAEKTQNQASDKSSGDNAYATLLPYVHPLVIGAVGRASSLSEKICTEILEHHLEDHDKAKKISVHLNTAYPSHDYPILPKEAKRIGLNVKNLDGELNDIMLDLHELYSEMGQRALTDYDEVNYHNNEIISIIESKDTQVYYQIDKDWHYRLEERRWVSMHDNSSWRKVENKAGETRQSILHIR